jgi:predicted N-formylglutamate amidohydrolase
MLGPGEPAPYEVVNPEGRAAVLLVCDHASARLPAALGDLGLAGVDRARHIAWDIGAADATRRLAALFDAPAILCGYSRLVVDCNRRLDDATLMPVVSDGSVVRGNQSLGAHEREARLDAIYRPYHEAIARRLDQWRPDAEPVVLSIHSCTPVMSGVARPWHIGVCWEDDLRVAGPVMEALRRRGDVHVGDNQPYALDRREDYTVPVHAADRGLRHLQVEFRQDLIDATPKAHRWADILAEALRAVLA